MEWLTRWWRELLRDVALTGTGLGLIIFEAVLADHPSPYIIGAGLSLTFPSTYVRIREILSVPSGTGGGSGQPSPPRGPEPSPASSAPPGE